MENWNPIKIIYFVDVRQSLHFKQAFEVASRAGWLERMSKDEIQKISEDSEKLLGDNKVALEKQKTLKDKKKLSENNLKETELFHAYN
jgi:hypothetical protein